MHRWLQPESPGEDGAARLTEISNMLSGSGSGYIEHFVAALRPEGVCRAIRPRRDVVVVSSLQWLRLRELLNRTCIPGEEGCAKGPSCFGMQVIGEVMVSIKAGVRRFELSEAALFPPVLLERLQALTPRYCYFCYNGVLHTRLWLAKSFPRAALAGGSFDGCPPPEAVPDAAVPQSPVQEDDY